MPQPLKIGILGAARIADHGIVDPCRALGHRLVAVAAWDRSRAETFAQQRGTERVHETYADVIDDPDVDVVYNALVNSLHATWNQYALEAGKHVLSEKPFASNTKEALLVRGVAREAPGQIVEGFHYLHHPVNLRLQELVRSGALGDIQRVDIELRIPGPPDTDPRWSLDLAGGATMDLGCYVLNAARQVGRWLDEAPSVSTAEPTLIQGDSAEEQILGDQTSYSYQLAALAETLQTGTPFLIDVNDSVANAELIDDVYRTAGLPTRGQQEPERMLNQGRKS